MRSEPASSLFTYKVEVMHMHTLTGEQMLRQFRTLQLVRLTGEDSNVKNIEDYTFADTPVLCGCYEFCLTAAASPGHACET